MLMLSTLLWLVWGRPCTASPTGVYRIGAGIADITGPAAGVIMMGYAQPSMVGHGIHTRLFARTFIVCEPDERHKCIVFVNLDACMTSLIVKMQVASRLKSEFGGVYHQDNVLISATHTHSGPAGYLQYVLFQISNLGWVKETFNAQVTGILRSVRRAHRDLSLGYMDHTAGRLDNANINRSPSAYMMNPVEERVRYESNVDKQMFLLKFFSLDGTPKGVLNWFAVHPTSMNSSNMYVSSDNKGFAELLFEEAMNSEAMPGRGKFVAAFASTNLGDVSPNINGPVCIDTGLPCDMDTSTCNGRVQMCVASGPGRNMYESTEIIGRRQFVKAMELFHDKSSRRVRGPIDYAHRYIDMSRQIVQLDNGRQGRTCSPAMGYSFAAGTTDGPGMLDFFQSDTKGNPMWNFIRNIIGRPSKDLEECHSPKPILFSTGGMTWPYRWQPSVVPVQLLRVGDVVIAAAPGELTTMSGRRLRQAVIGSRRGHLQERGFSRRLPCHRRRVVSSLARIASQFASGGEHVHVVVAGLSNAYSDYVTTFEEYQRQRYEGASTIYGPHTLSAYVKNFRQLADAMLSGVPLQDEASPDYMLSHQRSLVMPVMADYVPSPYQHFGHVIKQPPPVASVGQTVEAVFVSGHPRNNVMLERSFLHVLRRVSRRQWTVVATDASWHTLFKWRQTSSLCCSSEATVVWWISNSTVTGIYKLKHMGYHKTLLRHRNKAGTLSDTFYYEGESKPFKVIGLDERRSHRVMDVD